eukprot:TRINITY_DN16874_c3_g1_i1.p1 TRINITY_DN16874_c3_g1~~TRINITY_DN16874_c3_g1_i1.p1  ORF type:complete len:293 (+),score=44.59 TRINITY_DN16874_c3_g1_i1:284-1162(+)
MLSIAFLLVHACCSSRLVIATAVVETKGRIAPGLATLPSGEAIVRAQQKLIRRVSDDKGSQGEELETTGAVNLQASGAAAKAEGVGVGEEDQVEMGDVDTSAASDAEQLQQSQATSRGSGHFEGVRRESEQGNTSTADGIRAGSADPVSSEPWRRRSSGPRDPMHAVAALRRAGLAVAGASQRAAAWVLRQPTGGSTSVPGGTSTAPHDDDVEWGSLVEGVKWSPLQAVGEQDLRNHVPRHYLIGMIIAVMVLQLAIFLGVGWAMSSSCVSGELHKLRNGGSQQQQQQLQAT